LETVFTEASHRGKGIASALLKRCIEDGEYMGAARCFLLVAIGNDGALRVYNKLGLKTVAQLLHPDCQAALGLPGFNILVRDFPKGGTVDTDGGTVGRAAPRKTFTYTCNSMEDRVIHSLLEQVDTLKAEIAAFEAAQ
jgi:hypothetical protein